MFETLMESRARNERHFGGSITSVLFHSVLIAAAVLATARETISAPKPRETILVDLTPPPPVKTPPPEPMPVREVNPVVVDNPPTFPAIIAPDIIPTEIPPIDLSATPTPPDLSTIRGHTAVVGCVGPCPSAGTGSGVVGDSRVWELNDIRMQLREEPVAPRYPERLRQAGVDGNVLVKFVVDTLGRVDPASIEIVRSTHDLFTAAVRESVLRLRFNPAVVGDRKVSAAAMMPFHFTLKK
jgi:protein TonB